MKSYSLPDFLSYFRLSYIISPLNGKVCYIDKHGNAAVGLVYEDGSNVPIDYTTLSWKDVKTPLLGYRHVDNGNILWQAAIHKNNRRAKGLSSGRVGTKVPLETVAARALAGQDRIKGGDIGFREAKAIFFPEFKTVKESVRLLSSDKDAFGFALSPDAAITIGKNKENSFLFLFKGCKIAQSENGVEWKVDNPEYEGVISRHAN